MKVHERRTIRKYTQQPVEDELLNQLIEDSTRTQTMGNLQLYSIIVTRDSEMKSRLASAHFCQPMVTEAPVLLTICADFRRTTDWCNARNAEPGYDNFLSFLNASTDALLFTQTFCNLAEEKGLGICFLGTTIYNPALIIEVLNLPQLVVPVATLSIGWPAEEPVQQDRLPLEAVIHSETYQPYTKESIDTFYAPKESLQSSKEFVAENGKETLAQVYTDVRYRKEDNEAMSKKMMETLVRQGFAKSSNYPESQLQYVVETRPEVLDCDVVRFQNNKEKWVAFVGLMDGKPYEIFTGLMDDEEGIALPKSVTKGRIIKHIDREGLKRYDFQFENKRGYKTTVEGLSGKFNPEYWNYAKLISGVLRYKMPLENVVRLINSLELDNDNINSWASGVARALKRYMPGATVDEEEQ